MQKLLITSLLMVKVLLLTACQEEIVSGVTYYNIALAADSVRVATGNYAELTVSADFRVSKLITNKTGGLSAQNALVQESFDLDVKLGVCVVDDNGCVVNTEANTDISLPPSLDLEDGSSGAFFSKETFTIEEKTLSHTLKLTSQEKGSYSFRPFVILDGDPREPDETVEIAFE